MLASSSVSQLASSSQKRQQLGWRRASRVSRVSRRSSGRCLALFEKLVGFGKTAKLEYSNEKDKEMGFAQDKMNIRKESQGLGQKFLVTFKGADEEDITLEVPEDTYILDAADEAGLELPATCRGGICGTCVGRVVEGTVDQSDIQDLDYTLDEEQQEAGMALLCMARPASDCTIETQCDWGYGIALGGTDNWKGATGFKGAPEPIMGEKWEKSEAKSE